MTVVIVTDASSTPPRDDDATADVTPPEPTPAGAGGPVWTPPPNPYPDAPAARPSPVAQRGLRARTRAVVTRRVPAFVAAAALLVGLGVGGGVAFAAADGHGGDHAVVDGRDAPGGHGDSRDGDGRSGR